MFNKRDELIKEIKQTELIEKSYKEGLSSEEVEKRIKQGLANKVSKKVTKSFWRIFLDNVLSFFNLIYIVIGIFMAVAKLPLSNFFFLLPVLSNIVIGVITDVRARIAVDKLKLIVDPQVTVVRDGEEKRLPIEKVVLHDIVVYESGDQIATDGVVIEGHLNMDESLVTGESIKIAKGVGDEILSGTYVSSGKAYVRVTMVGVANYAEGIQEKAKKFSRPKSEIKRSTLLIFRVTGGVAIAVGVLMTIVRLLRTNWTISFEGYQEFISSLSGSLVAMIPAGLYLLTSLTLGIGVLNLAKKHMNVQELYCIEMLAHVDTICFDKTGTLTDGNLAIHDFYNFSNFSDDMLKSVVAGIVKATGDANPTALAVSKAYSPIDQAADEFLPFDSDRKFSAATFGELGTFAMGAFGFVKAETNEIVEGRINRLMAKGYRVLAVFHSPKAIKDGKAPHKFEVIGVIAISDNIKPDAKANIEWFKENGVDVKVISGDDPKTVSEIAKKVGVPNAENYISMHEVKDEDIPGVVGKYSVFGRVKPEQKAMLIKAMQKAGHKVAMTGDGVNDILALKRADCSIAMASGSSAARSAAHMISVDNDFSKLPDVVAEGRRVINNLQRTASLFLCKNIFAVFVSLIFLVSLMVGGPTYPFTTSSMLIWEIVSIGFGGFFLALQPASKRIDRSFIGNVLRRSIPGGIVQVVTVVVVFTISLLAPNLLSFEAATTVCVFLFSAISLLSLFLICMPLDLYRGTVFFAALISALGIVYLDNFVFPHPNGSVADTAILHAGVKSLSPAVWGVVGIIFVAMSAIYILLDMVIASRKTNKKD